MLTKLLLTLVILVGMSALVAIAVLVSRLAG